MAEAPAKPESAARRWLTRAALAAPFVLAITGFIFRYEMSHFIMMRRAMADPADEAAHEWIAEHSRRPIGDVAKLAAKHDADSLPDLFRALEHRLDVLFAVDQDQVRRFRLLMRSQSPNVRAATLQYLIAFGLPGAPDEFKEALGDHSMDVVLFALRVVASLRYADDAEWVTAVLRLTEHADERVRQRAWKTLGESRKAELLPRFLAALEGATPKEAGYVLRGMGLLAAPAGLPAVRRHLAHDNTAVAIAACRAIGNLGTAEDVETLIGMLAGPDRLSDDSGAVESSLHAMISWALHDLTGRGANGSHAEWQAWWEQNRDTYDLDEVVKSALLDWADDVRRYRACYWIRARNMQHLIPYLHDTFPEAERPHDVTNVLVWLGDTRAALSYVELFETGTDGSARLEALCELQRATLMDFFTDTDAWREWLEARRPNFRECRGGQE